MYTVNVNRFIVSFVGQALFSVSLHQPQFSLSLGQNTPLYDVISFYFILCTNRISGGCFIYFLHPCSNFPLTRSTLFFFFFYKLSEQNIFPIGSSLAHEHHTVGLGNEFQSFNIWIRYAFFSLATCWRLREIRVSNIKA